MRKHNTAYDSGRIARLLIACARELIAAKLSQGQRDMIDKYTKKRREGLDFGDVIPWNQDGRAYFPATRTIPDIEAPREIIYALAKLGYSITSYREGYAVKTIDVKDGQKTQSKGIGKILKNEVKDKELALEFDNRLGTSNKSEQKKFLVCITHNPEDVGAMSTGRNWTSCMRLPEDNSEGGGMHYDTALRQVQYGGLCAYLIDENDRTVEHPYARIAIKRLEGKGGEFIYKAENMIYGDGELANECGMDQLVKQVLEKSNAKTKMECLRFDTADPESYTDSGISREILIKKPEDVLDLSINDFMSYALSPSNLAELDDDFCKAVLLYFKSIPANEAISITNSMFFGLSQDYNVKIKFLETFIDYINFMNICIRVEIPLEFISRHPEKMYWPAILAHTGYRKEKFGRIWYAAKDLAPFSKYIDNSESYIRNFKQRIDDGLKGELVGMTIDEVDGEDLGFLRPFSHKISDRDESRKDGTVFINFTSLMSLHDLMEGNGREIVERIAGKVKWICADWLRFKCKYDDTFDGKTTEDIIRMVEGGELDYNNYVVPYRGKCDLMMNKISSQILKVFVNVYISFEVDNGTITVETYSGNSFNLERKEEISHHEITTFQWDSKIQNVLHDIMQRTIKESIKDA